MNATKLQSYLLISNREALRVLLSLQLSLHNSQLFFEDEKIQWSGVLIDLDFLGLNKVLEKTAYFRQFSSDCKIAMIADCAFLTSGLDLMRDKRIDYFIPADISEEEAKSLFNVFCSDKSDDKPPFLSEELLENYRKNIIEKIRVMSTAIMSDTTNALSVEQLDILRSAAHKIAGSAGSYGYKALGVICRQLDTYLKSNETKSEELHKVLKEFNRKLLFAIQGVVV